MKIDFIPFDVTLIGKNDIAVLCRHEDEVRELVSILTNLSADITRVEYVNFSNHALIGKHVMIRVTKDPTLRATYSSLGHFEGMLINRYRNHIFMDYAFHSMEPVEVGDLL